MTNHSLMPVSFDQNLDLFRRINRDLERLDKSFFWKDNPVISWTNERGVLPNIDVAEDDKKFQVTADLPGLEENNINIEINNGILSIRGEKKEKKEENRNNYHIIERTSGYFNRTLQLPTSIDESKVEATLKNGVLTITLPKFAEADTYKKRIEIKGE